MRKLFKLLSLILLVVLINCALVGCGASNNVSNELENENLIEHKLSYVVIRINPQIELVIDAEEKVVATNAVNADGEVVLSELKLIGLSCEDAVLAFTEKAIELGYIDVTAEENIVYVLAESETDEEEKELEDKLCGKIDKFFNEKGMHVKGKLEDLEEYKSLAEEWGVSLKLAKLISRVTELYPEMTIEEILELSKKELCELVKDENKKHGIPVQIRDEYKEQVEAIKEEFSRYFELKKELKKLEKQLKNESLTEEEKASLQSDYDLKLFEYETLKAEYETKLEEIKESCKEEIDKVKDEIKEEANDRFEKIEKYKTLAEEWNVTLYKAILISKILESNPELTLEEVLSLSNEELKELLGANCPEKEEKPENGKPEKEEDLENGNPDVEEEQPEDNKPNKEDKPENNKPNKEDKPENNKPNKEDNDSEIKEEIENLVNEYARLFELKKELISLKKQLKDKSLSEDEITALQEEYDLMYAEYKILKEEFKTKLEELKKPIEGSEEEIPSLDQPEINEDVTEE